jgi:hypothetical protein
MQPRHQDRTRQGSTAACALAPSHQSADRRGASRQQASAPGFLVIPDCDRGIACRVVELSATGVRVALESAESRAMWRAIQLPASLPLHLRVHDIEVRCRALWTVGDRIGLRFTSVMR